MLKPTYAIPFSTADLIPYRLNQFLLDLALTEQFQNLTAALSSQLTQLKPGERSGAIAAAQLLQRYQQGERNFQQANLEGVDLRGAVLPGINLSQANLKGADLSQANLQGANLTGTDLNQAVLSNTDLSAANLTGANLSAAEVNWVILTEAIFSADMVDCW